MESAEVAGNESVTEYDHYTENTNHRDKTVNSEGTDEFYFESDHLALKGNKDYLNVLKTIAILESQRIKGIKDMDELLMLQERALQDPMKFVEQLQQGEDLGIPPRQIIAEVPTIDWAAYNITLPPGFNRTPKPTQETMTETDESRSKVLVRGRIFDDSKPETFNQLWTSEEQQRLEELLIEYPPEEVESRRWQKIAAALGNRTTKQVCSRVQKYFIKLHKAGLPVPGRIPKMQNSDVLKRGYLGHRHQRHNHYLFRHSTFFPSQDVPVYMSDFDDDAAQANYPTTLASECESKLEDYAMSEDEPIPEKYYSTLEYHQLCLLRKVRREKDHEKKHVQHTGYKCDVCNEEPITGTRWHCIDCPPKLSVDFCTDCVITQMDSSNPHPWSHRLVDIRIASDNQGLWDEDYTPHSFSGRRENYNYLDPNFMPH